MSLSEDVRRIRAEIFEDLGEVLRVGSVEIPGKFYRRFREVPHTDGTFVGVGTSFDCQVDETILALELGDEVSVISIDEDGDERALGTFAFRRRIPNTGDETGLTVLELGAAV